jgi:hypothetical protein
MVCLKHAASIMCALSGGCGCVDKVCEGESWGVGARR